MKKLWPILFIIFLASCEAPPEKEVSGDVSEIFGKIYDAVATRANSSSPWYIVSGKSAMALEQGDSESRGAGLMSFFNYYEPQFCAINQSCYCTGSMRFTFEVKDASQTDGPKEETDKNYNVFDPYEDPTKTPTTSDPETDPTEEIFQVFLYELMIKPETTQLSEYCRPQSERSVRIIRYQNGEIIIQDSYRDILLRPRANN